MLYKRRINGRTVLDLILDEGYADVEGEISLGNLQHLAGVLNVDPYVIYVSSGPGETLRISAPSAANILRGR